MLSQLLKTLVITVLIALAIPLCYAKEETPPSLLPAITTQAPIYYIRIVSPENEETFQNGTQNIPVTLEVTPALEAQDKIQMIVDDIEVGDAEHSLTIELPWLPRGSHTIKAKILQQNGPGAESQTITVYQQRTSVILTPNRAK